MNADIGIAHLQSDWDRTLSPVADTFGRAYQSGGQVFHVSDQAICILFIWPQTFLCISFIKVWGLESKSKKSFFIRAALHRLAYIGLRVWPGDEVKKVQR